LENPTDLGKPLVEVARVAPTAVVEVEEESSVEVLTSVQKKMRDQAEGTGSKPVLEAAETKLGGQAVGTGEPVHVEDKSGEEPNLMEVDQVVRIGGEPVHKAMEEKIGTEPVPDDVEMGTGDIPVHNVGEGDLHFEDYLGDDFEKVGEYTPEKPSQSPSTPTPEHPAEETPLCAEPRRKGSKLWLGGRIFHGSEISQPSRLNPLHPPNKHHKNSLPNQPASHIG